MRIRVIGIVRASLVSAMLGSCGVAMAADEIHWTIAGPTSVTFDWRGSASENTVSYGPSAGSYTSTVTAVNPTGTCVPYSSAGPFWEARLTGLVADTLYHYSIANGPDHTFRTPPPPGAASFQVLAEADIGDSAYYTAITGVQQQMAQETASRFSLMVGDLTYADDHGQSHVDQHFNDVMVWSQDAAYMPAWGNHEWDSEPADDLRNYKGRFDFPNPQTSVGTPSVSDCGEDWYWFDYGNVRFIAYPEPWNGAWDDWNTKATALMNAAQADPNITWIVTYGHRPAYSSGHHSGNTQLQGYLGALGLSHSKYVLNVDGHSHDYERSYPQNGVTHVTVGTGGSALETDGPCLWLTCAQPNWSAVRYFHMGYLKLAFTPTSIQGSFICGPAGSGANDITCTPGSVIDSFNIVPSAPVTTIYVDKSNPQCTANGTGTASQPFCTITDGVNRAVAGNTVVVKAGTYSEDVKITKSGTSANPIVVKAEPGANVVVSGQFRGFEISGKSWITVQGFTVSDTSSFGIYVSSGASNIKILGNHVSRAGQPAVNLVKSGIYVSDTTNSLISGNTTDYNTDAGIQVVGTSTNVTVSGNFSSHNARGYTRAAPGIDVRASGNVIMGNICHDNEDSGIQVFSSGGLPSPNNLVVDNLCYNNGDHGIDVSSAGSQTIIGNTIYGSTTAGINIEGTSLLPSSGTTLRNNISVDNAVASSNTKGNIRVDPSSVSGTTIDYDLTYLSSAGVMIVWNGVNYSSLASFVAATGQETHGLQATPHWASPGSGDFHIVTGSPAIDSADSGTSGATAVDLEGQPRADDPGVSNTGTGPRAYDDRGAYEHPVCGNGIKEYGEQCDGGDIGAAVCTPVGCTGGDPGCTPQCTLDYSACTGCPVCGNGIKEFGEDCDGGDLAGKSCESFGECSTGGGLSCTSSCKFNFAGCSCGDHVVQCGEVCDGPNLNGQTCASQGFPAGGVLACRPNCAAFDTSSCSVCGDGVKQPSEACDGSNLGGATCASQGCFAGTPTCSGSCTVNYATCSNCWAATLYVNQANPACSNSGQGTSAAPFCTINAAASRVMAGGTVIVSSGTYSEYVKVLSSGTSTAPIVFKAAPGATVNVTGGTRGFEISNKNWITIDGFNVSSTTDYGIYVSSLSTNVTIRNNHVSHAGSPVNGSTKPGIVVSQTSDSLITGNTTQDNSDSGIYVTSSSTNVTVSGNTSLHNARGYTVSACGIEVRSSGNTVSGNICHDNENGGICVTQFQSGSTSPNNLIVNNVTYSNARNGIQLKFADHSRVVGNTVYANAFPGIDLSSSSTDCILENNITVDNAPNVSGSSGGNIRFDSSSIANTTLDYDVVFRSPPGTLFSWSGTTYTSLSTFVSATGKETHGIQSSPLFVSSSTADFRLKVGSPAMDSANSSVSGALASDINGTVRTDDPATTNTGTGARAYDDRGAYEYPLDADHDGYASDEDCDDLNPLVNPGVVDDSCDGIDQNCNGTADEEFVPTPTGGTCGIGACSANGRTACVNGVVTSTCTTGTPAANDATCNGIDDDCDGPVDEDFVPTQTSCGTGACASHGVITCSNGALQPDTCTPGTPHPETCNGIDDNCNGTVDEGTNVPTTCGVGACAATGVIACVNGTLQPNTCTPGSPHSETCNGIDDNCNGTVDDGADVPTTCGVGACAATGVIACVGGVSQPDTCTPGTPHAETCNGIDDNCNGTVDEGTNVATSCGVGACAATGVIACVGGVSQPDTCSPGTPHPETCNGIDDNCNGTVDEGADVATTCGTGACAATGVIACVNGVSQPDTCTPGSPSPETCNGIDDNCNGTVDEGTDVPTTCGTGACAATGVIACVGGSQQPDTCTQGTPQPETCNGIDDNCDGTIDEGTDIPTTCGVGACASTGVIACVNGVPQPDTCNPGVEVCNGLDDNCDGNVDEGTDVPTTCGVGACAATGVKACVDGALQPDTCTPGSPQPETCNGIDDNCNGSVDEGTDVPTTCGVGACAATGVIACVNGAPQADTCTPHAPAANDATCDGIDDDCDGSVDEDFVSVATTCGVGACSATGHTVCVNGTIADTCVPGTPGPEVGCDGIDNDCNPATPDVMDGDGDSVTCASDCNDADPAVFPGAPEINDGKDNQCPGDAGYGLIDEISSHAGFLTPGDKTAYSWPAQSGATAYEVARADSSDFSSGCQSNQTSTPSWIDAAVPTSGKAFYYLVRAVTPFTGTWGKRSSGAQRTVSCSGP